MKRKHLPITEVIPDENKDDISLRDLSKTNHSEPCREDIEHAETAEKHEDFPKIQRRIHLPINDGINETVILESKIYYTIENDVQVKQEVPEITTEPNNLIHETVLELDTIKTEIEIEITQNNLAHKVLCEKKETIKKEGIKKTEQDIIGPDPNLFTEINTDQRTIVEQNEGEEINRSLSETIPESINKINIDNAISTENNDHSQQIMPDRSILEGKVLANPENTSVDKIKIEEITLDDILESNNSTQMSINTSSYRQHTCGQESENQEIIEKIPDNIEENINENNNAEDIEDNQNSIRNQNTSQEVSNKNSEEACVIKVKVEEITLDDITEITLSTQVDVDQHICTQNDNDKNDKMADRGLQEKVLEPNSKNVDVDKIKVEEITISDITESNLSTEMNETEINVPNEILPKQNEINLKEDLLKESNTFKIKTNTDQQGNKNLPEKNNKIYVEKNNNIENLAENNDNQNTISDTILSEEEVIGTEQDLPDHTYTTKKQRLEIEKGIVNTEQNISAQQNKEQDNTKMSKTNKDSTLEKHTTEKNDISQNTKQCVLQEEILEEQSETVDMDKIKVEEITLDDITESNISIQLNTVQELPDHTYAIRNPGLEKEKNTSDSNISVINPDQQSSTQLYKEQDNETSVPENIKVISNSSSNNLEDTLMERESNTVLKYAEKNTSLNCNKSNDNSNCLFAGNCPSHTENEESKLTNEESAWLQNLLQKNPDIFKSLNTAIDIKEDSLNTALEITENIEKENLNLANNNGKTAEITTGILDITKPNPYVNRKRKRSEENDDEQAADQTTEKAMKLGEKEENRLPWPKDMTEKKNKSSATNKKQTTTSNKQQDLIELRLRKLQQKYLQAERFRSFFKPLERESKKQKDLDTTDQTEESIEQIDLTLDDNDERDNMEVNSPNINRQKSNNDVQNVEVEKSRGNVSAEFQRQTDNSQRNHQKSGQVIVEVDLTKDKSEKKSVKVPKPKETPLVGHIAHNPTNTPLNINHLSMPIILKDIIAKAQFLPKEIQQNRFHQLAVELAKTHVEKSRGTGIDNIRKRNIVEVDITKDKSEKKSVNLSKPKEKPVVAQVAINQTNAPLKISHLQMPIISNGVIQNPQLLPMTNPQNIIFYQQAAEFIAKVDEEISRKNLTPGNKDSLQQIDLMPIISNSIINQNVNFTPKTNLQNMAIHQQAVPNQPLNINQLQVPIISNGIIQNANLLPKTNLPNMVFNQQAAPYQINPPLNINQLQMPILSNGVIQNAHLLPMPLVNFENIIFYPQAAELIAKFHSDAEKRKNLAAVSQNTKSVQQVDLTLDDNNEQNIIEVDLTQNECEKNSVKPKETPVIGNIASVGLENSIINKVEINKSSQTVSQVDNQNQTNSLEPEKSPLNILNTRHSNPVEKDIVPSIPTSRHVENAPKENTKQKPRINVIEVTYISPQGTSKTVLNPKTLEVCSNDQTSLSDISTYNRNTKDTTQSKLDSVHFETTLNNLETSINKKKKCTVQSKEYNAQNVVEVDLTEETPVNIPIISHPTFKNMRTNEDVLTLSHISESDVPTSMEATITKNDENAVNTSNQSGRNINMENKEQSPHLNISQGKEINSKNQTGFDEENNKDEIVEKDSSTLKDSMELTGMLKFESFSELKSSKRKIKDGQKVMVGGEEYALIDKCYRMIKYQVGDLHKKKPTSMEKTSTKNDKNAVNVSSQSEKNVIMETGKPPQHLDLSTMPTNTTDDTKKCNGKDKNCNKQTGLHEKNNKDKTPAMSSIETEEKDSSTSKDSLEMAEILKFKSFSELKRSKRKVKDGEKVMVGGVEYVLIDNGYQQIKYCKDPRYNKNVKWNVLKKVKGLDINQVDDLYKKTPEENSKTSEEVENLVAIKCDKCDFKTLKGKKDLILHSVVHRPNAKIYRCTKCSFKGTCQNYFKKHMKSHFEKNKENKQQMYKCEKCSYGTNDKSNLKKHHRVHLTAEEKAALPDFKCDQCDFLTKFVDMLTVHKRSHEKLGKATVYKCEKCPYFTRNGLLLKNHVVTHIDPKDITEDMILKCETCTFATHNKLLLDRHVYRVHKNPKKRKLLAEPMKCGECAYQSNSRRAFVAHVSVTHSKKNFNCEHCDYKTTTLGRLKIHMIRHLDPSECEVFECYQCDYKTNIKSDLAGHMRHRHLNQKRKRKE